MFAILLFFVLFEYCRSSLLLVEVVCAKKPCALKRGGVLVFRYYWANFGEVVPSYTFTLWKRVLPGATSAPGAWSFVSALGTGLGIVVGEDKYFVGTIPTSIVDTDLGMQFGIGVSASLAVVNEEPGSSNLAYFLMDLVSFCE